MDIITTSKNEKSALRVHRIYLVKGYAENNAL